MNVDQFIKQFIREQNILESINRASERIRREARAKTLPTNRAFDSTGLTPLLMCSDGCLRTEAKRTAWIENGYKDELTALRKKFQRQHCGGSCSVGRPGHICSCRQS